MTVVVSDYVNVARRATELDCEVPGGLALIPRHFDTAVARAELLHESHASTVRKLWRAAGVDETPLEPADQAFPEVSEKDDQAGEAWAHLIDAQDQTRAAIRAHDLAAPLMGYASRLELLEGLLFPPQVFMSPGVVIKSSKCSICDEPYEDCEHIKGNVYMGRFCARMITEVAEFTEVSVVEDPADKRARALVIGDGTTERDYMTWRVVETDKRLGEAEGSTA
jgi:hypothetical protein